MRNRLSWWWWRLRRKHVFWIRREGSDDEYIRGRFTGKTTLTLETENPFQDGQLLEYKLGGSPRDL